MILRTDHSLVISHLPLPARQIRQVLFSLGLPAAAKEQMRASFDDEKKRQFVAMHEAKPASMKLGGGSGKMRFGSGKK